MSGPHRSNSLEASQYGLDQSHFKVPFIMRIAAFFYQGQPHVGLVSQDSSAVTPFDLPLADRELGALTLVDTLSRGEALPPQGAAIALKDVQLRAPLPHPRRNIFCVGKNYHAHAKEFARSG
ncbi:MAG: hypothetical protein ACOVN1_11355, partial [Limnohabitans sp.]